MRALHFITFVLREDPSTYITMLGHGGNPNTPLADALSKLAKIVGRDNVRLWKYER